MKAILLDIEGTTTPIDFVHRTLFPFARARIGEYVKGNFAALQTEIAQLKTEYKKDFSEQLYGRDFRTDAPETIAAYLKFLIEADRKSTPLKSIQGKIWQTGYETGELRSTVFADVPPALERWRAENKKVAIYSSGSRLAQQLIFKYSNFGDLTPFVAAYFDTETGGKKEPDSYRKIAARLSADASEILFVSDAPAELGAARTANLQTALAVRAGNAPLAGDATQYRIVKTFDEFE